jgi:hypothetical protein
VRPARLLQQRRVPHTHTHTAEGSHASGMPCSDAAAGVRRRRAARTDVAAPTTAGWRAGERGPAHRGALNDGPEGARQVAVAAAAAAAAAIGAADGGGRRGAKGRLWHGTPRCGGDAGVRQRMAAPASSRQASRTQLKARMLSRSGTAAAAAPRRLARRQRSRHVARAQRRPKSFRRGTRRAAYVPRAARRPLGDRRDDSWPELTSREVLYAARVGAARVKNPNPHGVVARGLSAARIVYCVSFLRV